MTLYIVAPQASIEAQVAVRNKSPSVGCRSGSEPTTHGKIAFIYKYSSCSIRTLHTKKVKKKLFQKMYSALYFVGTKLKHHHH